MTRRFLSLSLSFRLPREIIPSAHIGIACLPDKYQKLPVGTKCTIIGWGKRKNLDDSGTKYLHEAQVPIVQNEDCKEVYDDYTITKNMFCAGKWWVPGTLWSFC